MFWHRKNSTFYGRVYVVECREIFALKATEICVEIDVVLGASGSGKSTAAKLMLRNHFRNEYDGIRRDWRSNSVLDILFWEYRNHGL